MKKQILILVLFVMATFAGVNNSYGQCTPDPLHPAAGVAYDYEVAISGTAGGTLPIYQWFVTKDIDLITAPVKIAAAAGDFTVGVGAGLSAYDAVAATTNKINLTWSSAAVASATPYYLVVKYTETSASTPSCTTENMRVWMIDPLNTFLLTVVGSDVAGVTANNSICAANITAALITAGASPTVEYTYGPNSLYYRVTASGAIGTWTPSISLPALTGSALGQVYASADWSPDNGTTWNTFGAITPAGGNFTTAIVAPVTVAGTAIIIRVVVTNDNFETLAAQTVTVGVDGVLPGGVNDIVDATTCTDAAAFAKTGAFIVNPRPTVTDATTDVPNVTNYITKAP